MATGTETNWRRFYLGLAALMVLIALARLVSGNIIGALLPLLLAALFGSTATNYPLIQRARQAWRLFKLKNRHKGD